MVTPALETLPVADPQLPDAAVPDLVPEVVSAPAPGAERLAPAPAPDTAAVAPAGPSAEVLLARQELAETRQRLAQMEQERQAEVTEAGLQREYQQVYQDELRQGMTEADALRIAQRHYSVSKRVIEQEQSFRQAQAQMQGKRNAAADFGERYGVAPQSLMRFNSPQEMEEHASGVSREAKRISDLEAQVKALTQGRVPAQNLNGSGGGVVGGLVATTANIDKLWFDYDVQHPNAVNPYDAQYRKLLNG